MARPAYDRVIAEAIADFVKYGFDSPERLEFWTEQIREAAIEAMGTYADIDNAVQEALTRVFSQTVDKQGVLRFAPGVSAYQLRMMRPELHAELQRRIYASTELIRLDRPQAIAKTLQRFQGWATSIPEGGSDITKKGDQKKEIKKALAQLPYVERRVIIDQSAKLFSAINTTVAVNGGAIGGIWRSHRHQRDYNGRPKHNERDGKFFVVPDNWAEKAGYLKRGSYDYTDSVEQPGEFVFCFPGDTSIQFADGVEISYRRFYDGELTEIVTGSGKTLRGTPNHPILTSKGWIAIGSLQEGDYVIEVSDKEIEFTEMNVNCTPPTISDLFSSISVSGYSESTTGTVEQFHGDGGQSDVDIVHSARELPFRVDFRSGEGFNKLLLSKPSVFRSAVRHVDFVAKGCRNLCSRFFHRFGKFFSPFLPFSVEPYQMGVADPSSVSADFFDAASHRSAGHPESFGQGQHTFTTTMEQGEFLSADAEVFFFSGNTGSEVESTSLVATPQPGGINPDFLCDFLQALPFSTKLARVVKVSVGEFSGHVYNLQTTSDWYVAQGIIAHNCKCMWQYVFSLRSVPVEMLSKKGVEALAEARRKVAAIRS